jgi:eukaryotic-like serine/threonine-protein kinase
VGVKVTPERWQEIERLYNSALAVESGQRESFIKEACSGDESVEREVKRLLASQSRIERFIESPAFEVAAKTLAKDRAKSNAATLVDHTLTHYRMVEKIGAGGMGDVYRARDDRLGRDVAIKVLQAEFVRDPERKKRFIQEAKAASALNHPNIVTVHEIANDHDVDFIVMEHVAGKTLDQFIGRRGLRLPAALNYATQIAEALAAAHAAGIVHRDLKPGNVLITASGRVKLLDFGLAKLTESARESLVPSESQHPQTEEGRIFGTVAYMSPEQAEGKPVDARSDVFSFGSLLYEMLTGQRTFHGDSKLSTLSAILHREPKPIGEVIASVSPEVEHLVTRCLRKDPARRWQHMSDLKVALEDLKEQSESGKLGASVPSAPTRRTLRWWLAAAIGTVLGVAAVRYVNHSRSSGSVEPMSAVPLTAYPGEEDFPTFSPDGTLMAFSWNRDGNKDIYVKVVDSPEEPHRLTTDPAEDSLPKWSPDGRWIAFVRDGSLVLISPFGGSERKLASVGGSSIDWGADGKSLVATAANGGESSNQLILVSADTGEVTPIVYEPEPDERWAFELLAVSPDGRRIAVSRYKVGAADLAVIPFEGGTAKRVAAVSPSINGLVWTPDGKELIWAEDAVNNPGLRQIAVDGPLGGVPQRLSGVGEDGRHPTFARQGFRRGVRMAYSLGVGHKRRLLRVDLSAEGKMLGEPRPIATTTRVDFDPQISDDGSRIVFASNRSGVYQIWASASDGSNSVKLTTSAALFPGSPRWSPNGTMIVFDGRDDPGNADIYSVPAKGGPVRRLTSDKSIEARPFFSTDGRWVYFRSDTSGERRYYRMPADGNSHSAGEWQQVISSYVVEAFPSADGKYLYFPRGFDEGIFSVPAGGGSEREVIHAGHANLWSITGKAIYYVDRRTASPTLMRFDIKTSVTTKVGPIGNRVAWDSSPAMCVSRDERFLVYVERDEPEADLMLVDNFR